LLEYGSFHLEIYTPDSDIDLVCVVPNFIDESEDFFDILFKILGKNKNIKNLVKITEAYIPIIKMNYSGVDVDLIFA